MRNIGQPGGLRRAEHLLRVAKNWHAYDDAGHRRAMPNCPDCAAIRRAEGRGE